MSRTSSAPCPRVMSLMRVTAASPESSTSSAPIFLAISSLSAEVSTATMVVAPLSALQHLDGHLAEAAGPNHHRGRARPQQVERPFDRVVAGECGIAEWSGLAGIEVSQRNQESRRRDTRK